MLDKIFLGRHLYRCDMNLKIDMAIVGSYSDIFYIQCTCTCIQKRIPKCVIILQMIL